MLKNNKFAIYNIMGCCSGNRILETSGRGGFKKNYMDEKNIKSINDLKLITSNLIIERTEPFNKFYRIIESLGGGSFGKVYKCLHFVTNQERALKIVKLETKTSDGQSAERIIKEIEFLAVLDHPHILKVYEYFKDKYNYYIATELLEGGDLYEYITKVKVFSEIEAAKVFSQILSAVTYLHSKGIVHRDLKPENIAVDNSMWQGVCGLGVRTTTKTSTRKELRDLKMHHKDISDASTTEEKQRIKTISSNKLRRPILSELNVKLIDFGASCYYSKNEILTLKVGTPYYIAPEVLKREYDDKCDIWSAGVILYILLIGKPPFDDKTRDGIFEKILISKFDKESKEWCRISSDAQDLITKMLNPNYKQRPNAKECYDHPWIQHNLKLFELIYNPDDKKDSDFKEKDSKMKDALQNLRRFSVRNKFQQATVAHLIRHVADKNLVDSLKDIFQKFDVNNDGVLSYDEVRKGLLNYCDSHPDEEYDFDDIIKRLDQDESQKIEYEEFLRNMIDMKSLLSKQNLKIAFNLFDTDKNGVLSLSEIKDALGVISNEDISEKDSILKQLMMTIDSNGDGTISFEEFYQIMMKITEKRS